MKHTGGALLALMILAACGGSDASAPATPDGGVIIGADGAPIAPPPPPPPPTPDVGGEAPNGIFVSTSKGIDGADGAVARPLRTIADGLALAKLKGLPVNVCAETYPEAVTMIEGVSMLGYFDCSATPWKRSKSRAFIVSPTSPAVYAENLTAATKFEGFDVSAPNIGGAPAAGVPAASSYGFVIKSSKNLSIAESTIRSGDAQGGLDGVQPASNNVDTGGKKDGKVAGAQIPCTGISCTNNSIAVVAGKAGGTSTCAQGAPGYAGGQGGDGPFVAFGAIVTWPAGRSANGRPMAATAEQAAGANTSGLATNTPGGTGSAGAAGTLGQNGVWSFGGDAFAPGNGTPGGIGLPGKGGGGGAGTTVWWLDNVTVGSQPAGHWYGLAGAGGGAGGCGGLPGTAGLGGGASIALLSINSEVSITDSRIESRKGGRAGKGALGLPGVDGGFGGGGKGVGGVADNKIYGSPGGTGGTGGPAGLSGHGAPGPSIALVFSGTRPTTAVVDLVPGDPGDGQPDVVVGGQSLPAVVGIGKKEHSF